MTMDKLEMSGWFRARAGGLFPGYSLSNFARFMNLCGDPRPFGDVRRWVQRLASADSKVPPEVRVIFYLLEHPDEIPRLIDEACPIKIPTAAEAVTDC